MLREFVITSFAGCMLAMGAMGADIVVRIAPPHAVVEARVASPGAGYVYQKGYHRWDGNAYAWTPGVWVRPPHAHARWVDQRWEHRKNGYVSIEGHWR